MVEIGLNELIFLGVALTPFIALGSYLLLKKTKLKRTISNSNEAAILDHYNVLMNINSDQKSTLNSQRMKITMLQKKQRELEGFEEEEKPVAIDIKALLPIAQRFGIAEPQLQMLLQSEKAQKFLKKNADIIEGVLPLLAQFAGSQKGSNELLPIPSDTA